MLEVLFGDPNEKKITRYTTLVNDVNALATNISNLTDKELQNKTVDLSIRVGQSSDFKVFYLGFCCVRSVSQVLGLRHFDVQLIGGMMLHDGKIAEMKTGERRL